MHSVSEASSRRIWFGVIVATLIVMWCVLDSWNHDMSSQLFQLSEIKALTPDHPVMPRQYTLTVAFLQFVFMAFAFCTIFVLKTVSAGESVAQHVANLRPIISDMRWPGLVSTHIFGSLLLHSLMMPAQMMSLALFATTRAVEVPIAAGVRAKVFGARSDGPSVRTTMLMSAAAWLLFFSYTHIAECLCVWSGFGVALSGAAFCVVYALLLTLPAANVVLQESILDQLQVSPILMLAIQNLGAAVLFTPILFAAHWLGYEDVYHAAAMIGAHRAVYMTVLWLCVQTVVISAVTVGLLLTMNSFWAVAIGSLRVVFWWSRELLFFYFTNGSLLSVSEPHASLWSFVMFLGVVLAFSAFVTDMDRTEDVSEDKSLLKSSDRSIDANTIGMGRYV